MDVDGRLIEHAERQTRALERLVLLAQVVLFLAFVGGVLWVIALLGS